MVSGRFCYTADPVPSEGGQYEVQDIVCTEEQRGSGIYARNDFNPSLTSPAPPAALSECPAPDDAVPTPWPVPADRDRCRRSNDSAFLVRLRRSNEFQDCGGQVEPSVGSSGPSLPLTFGKGTTIFGDDPNGGYSVRRDGLTVRATAIADGAAGHARRSAADQPGAAGRHAVCAGWTRACSRRRAQPVTLTVSINPVTGVMTRTGAGDAHVSDQRASSAGSSPTRRRSAPSARCRRLPPWRSRACRPPSFTDRYGPVYLADAGGAVNRVIGFTRITFTRVAGLPGARAAVHGHHRARRRRSWRASNATRRCRRAACRCRSRRRRPSCGELFDKNRVRAGRLNYAPVLVAVLAR